MRVSLIIIWQFSLLLANPSFSQSTDSVKIKAELHGYIKDMPSVSFGKSLDSVEFLNLFHNRLNFLLRMPGNFTFKAEMRNRFFAGSQAKKIPGLSESLENDDGLIDLSFVPIDEPGFIWQTNIDRLNINWFNKKWDLTLGRQRINWGVHTIWNPNDLFNTYNYLDFDYEERPGSDAIRVQYNVKEMSTLDFAWKSGKNGKDQVAALLYKFNRKGYDWQFLAGKYINDLVVGGGWAGSIGQVGFKGEGSYFHPGKHFSDTTGTVSFSTGFDYTMEKGWYLSFSYLLNTAGDNGFQAFGSGLLLNPTAREPLPFKHTTFFQVNKIFNPLISGSFGLMYAPGGTNFLLFFPAVQYSLSENAELAVFGQHFFGMDETYNTLGNAIYLRFKWNF